jgi:glycosyl transferase family 87
MTDRALVIARAQMTAALVPERRRAIWHGLVVAGLIFNAVFLVFWFPRLDLWIDARAWWHIDLANLYGPGEQSLALIGAFRYAPVIAWLFYPATFLSWPALVAVYLALSSAALVAMTGRKALLFIVAFPPVLLELVNGNIHLFMALAVWAGLRWPAAWAFILLTKVTPGVGLLWFAGRREWRGLAVALGVTAAIVAVGVAIAPGLWLEWVRSLTIAANVPTSPGVPPLALRLPVAAALAYVAGRRDQAWLVPVAVFFALPILWLQGLAILTASFPLYWDRARWHRHRKDAVAGHVPAGAPA